MTTSLATLLFRVANFVGGMTKQTIFTVIAPIKPGFQDDVRDMLVGTGHIGPEPADGVFGFQSIRALHFASLFLYDDPDDGWSLVFESNIDGEIEPYLDRMMIISADKDGGRFWLDLFSHCEGFTENTLDALKAYMLDRVHFPAAAYVSAPGLPRDQVLLDAAIYRVVDRVLGSGKNAYQRTHVEQDVLAALDTDPSTAGCWFEADDAPYNPTSFQRAFLGIRFIAEFIVFVIVSLLNLVLERNAREDRERPDLALVRSQKAYEDFLPTNHMVSVVHLHRGTRVLAKYLGFGLIQLLARIVFYKGKLGNIDTIKFAHWAFTNDRRRLLFVSNFGGSWDSYLDDFTLKANNGLTLAWAHGVGFPKSWLMLWGGAAKGPEFIDWARRSMVPSLVWYNAYPGISAANIQRNRKVRDALIRARKRPGAIKWLELL